MKFEALMRAENIVGKQALIEFQEIVEIMTDLMLEDGFEYNDAKEFLLHQLNELLGE